MRSRSSCSPPADRSELLRRSRDALRQACVVPLAPSPPQALVADLAVLGQLLDELDHALGRVTAELRGRVRAGELAVVDGPFRGEPDPAVSTMDLWRVRAAEATAEARRAVDNTQIAASGLAQRH